MECVRVCLVRVCGILKAIEVASADGDEQPSTVLWQEEKRLAVLDEPVRVQITASIYLEAGAS